MVKLDVAAGLLDRDAGDFAITEQIIGFLKQTEAGMAVYGLCRQCGFSNAKLYQYQAKYGGMEAADEMAQPLTRINRQLREAA